MTASVAAFVACSVGPDETASVAAFVARSVGPVETASVVGPATGG